MIFKCFLEHDFVLVEKKLPHLFYLCGGEWVKHNTRMPLKPVKGRDCLRKFFTCKNGECIGINQDIRLKINIIDLALRTSPVIAEIRIGGYGA